MNLAVRERHPLTLLKATDVVIIIFYLCFYQTLLEFSQVQQDADIQDLLTKVITEDKDEVNDFFSSY